MYKLVILIFLIGCQSSIGEISKIENKHENISFNVVEKKLIFNTQLPEQTETLINEWFSKRIKVDGFQGVVSINLINYNEEIINITDGKKIIIEISISIDIENNDKFKSVKNYNLKINEYGTLTGDFTLSEVDTLISNTRKSLVNRMNSKLKSEF